MAEPLADTTAATPVRWKGELKRLLYVAIAILLAIFLIRLGAEPWRQVAAHWPTMIAVAVVSALAMLLQAASFRTVLPDDGCRPGWLELTRIWALSGAISAVAPVFVGVGTRATLLVQAGLTLGACVSTSARQAWLGLESALLFAAVSVLLVQPPGAGWIAALLASAGVAMVAVRITATRTEARRLPARLRRWWDSLRAPVGARAWLLFALQVPVMAATYYAGYVGLGAAIGFEHAILLATVTIMTSVVVFIPMGLGVLDALWVYAATRAGLSLADSVALAILLRTSYLSAAVFVAALLSVLPRVR
ncbi:MAG: flippase-like domain-containing protein [Zoogloeaceae bacterium]|nr:flippase-like domain-containing protein [Rhodocyclaceae bacterium]MCP5237940.1 flippase-like domain-containing protein [Zoogloeaceae bacterium]